MATLMLTALIITIFWLIIIAVYLLLSKKQGDLTDDLAKLNNELGSSRE